MLEANLEKKEKLVFPASQDQPAETDYLAAEVFPAHLVLKEILERMVSKENQDHQAPRETKDLRETWDLSAVLDLEATEVNLDHLVHLERKDHQV